MSDAATSESAAAPGSRSCHGAGQVSTAIPQVGRSPIDDPIRTPTRSLTPGLWPHKRDVARAGRQVLERVDERAGARPVEFPVGYEVLVRQTETADYVLRRFRGPPGGTADDEGGGIGLRGEPSLHAYGLPQSLGPQCPVEVGYAESVLGRGVTDYPQHVRVLLRQGMGCPDLLPMQNPTTRPRRSGATSAGFRSSQKARCPVPMFHGSTIKRFCRVGTAVALFPNAE